MTLDDIVDMWTEDTKIFDPKNPEPLEGVHATARLHPKYLRILTEYRRQKIKLEDTYYVAKRYKERYFNGELTQKELEKFGWDQWQFNRPKSNAAMEVLLKGDSQLRKMNNEIEECNTGIYVLESIMGRMKQHDYAMGSTVKWKIHQNGG